MPLGKSPQCEGESLLGGFEVVLSDALMKLREAARGIKVGRNSRGPRFQYTTPHLRILDPE